MENREEKKLRILCRQNFSKRFPKNLSKEKRSNESPQKSSRRKIIFFETKNNLSAQGGFWYSENMEREDQRMGPDPIKLQKMDPDPINQLTINKL